MNINFHAKKYRVTKNIGQLWFKNHSPRSLKYLILILLIRAFEQAIYNYKAYLTLPPRNAEYNGP